MVGTRARDCTAALAAVFLLWVASPVRAGDTIRLYGEENVGTASAQFLRLPVGARAVSLGQAYSALAIDGSAIYWNPAGLMRTPGRTNYFASHAAWTADIDLDYAAYHRRGQNFAYGLMFGSLRSGDILRTDELHQEGTGQYVDDTSAPSILLRVRMSAPATTARSAVKTGVAAMRSAETIRAERTRARMAADRAVDVAGMQGRH